MKHEMDQVELYDYNYRLYALEVGIWGHVWFSLIIDEKGIRLRPADPEVSQALDDLYWKRHKLYTGKDAL